MFTENEIVKFVLYLYEKELEHAYKGNSVLSSLYNEVRYEIIDRYDGTVFNEVKKMNTKSDLEDITNV